MKFAKELSDQLVPEWQEKYLRYKQAKKKLKGVARAMRNADKSPGAGRPPVSESLRDAPVYTFLNAGKQHTARAGGVETRPGSLAGRSASSAGGESARGRDPLDAGGGTPRAGAQPQSITEHSPLHARGTEGRGMTRYGSIIGSPPGEETPAMAALHKQASLLELPDPALDPNAPSRVNSHAGSGQLGRRVSFNPQTNRLPTHNEDHKPSTGQQPGHSSLKAKYKSVFGPKRVNSLPTDGRPFMKRMLSMQSPKTQQGGANGDIALEAYRELDFRQVDFFAFLDKELEKIEDFYMSKENQATERLKVLREQLHIMRERRLEEIEQAEHHDLKHAMDNTKDKNKHRMLSVDHAVNKVRPNHVGPTSRALAKLGTPNAPDPQTNGNGTSSAMAARAQGAPDLRDYERRRPHGDVPYRIAKRKLKIALAEYYRGLELLKSYALLNGTAFRKINKKFDKTVNARPSGRYMSDKVLQSHFVKSELLDAHIHAVEDLYARYFERGSHKTAVSKLRAKLARSGDYTGSVWRQGVLTATGLVLAIQGTVYGGEQVLQAHSPNMATTASYLLQVYAGYMLVLLLSWFFVLDARIFSKAKVNYPFIFEFDGRNVLDWRQLSEIPAFFTLLLGLTMWLNFQQVGGNEMYIYWPVVLIGLSAASFCIPAPFFYPYARKWFLYSNWRLLLAGIYPVEFRDFFLGDMFCSLTYTLGGTELFFCLYARHWGQPDMCNSGHSRLLGFFTCLPGIWRLLQCLRRYYDTRNIFPHLVNGGKYTFTILTYMSLSLFRVNKNNHLLALFIAFATVNGIYCSVWDLVMDWSLGVPSAKHKFLRHTLAYKRIWWYYAAMILDPILRFNWVFYAIYAYEAQHSSLVSLFVALSEVCRRGIWVIFRVENEHCTNVGRFRASRDVPLPYEIDDGSKENLLNKADEDDVMDSRKHKRVNTDGASDSRASGADLEQGQQSPWSTVRRRLPDIAAQNESPIVRALRKVGSTMLSAHAQDYERKRKPDVADVVDQAADHHGLNDDEDDEDEDDGGDSSDEGMMERRSADPQAGEAGDPEDERDRQRTEEALRNAGERRG